jgi:hypothetical protein
MSVQESSGYNSVNYTNFKDENILGLGRPATAAAAVGHGILQQNTKTQAAASEAPSVTRAFALGDAVEIDTSSSTVENQSKEAPPKPEQPNEGQAKALTEVPLGRQPIQLQDVSYSDFPILVFKEAVQKSCSLYTRTLASVATKSLRLIYNLPENSKILGNS